MAIPNWMTKTWQMTMMNGSSLSSTFSVDFDTSTDPIMVKFQDQSNTTWGTLETSSVTAAASSTVTVTSVIGTTSSGQAFHIDCDGTNLSCYLDDASYNRHFFPRRRWLAAGLGAGVGTLLGAVVGLVFRSPLVGTLAGLAAAISSPATARIVDESEAGGGSSPVWTAGDPTGRIIKPGRHSVVRATA